MPKSEFIDPEHTSYVWEVFGASSDVIDCRDEQHSNWLMFVKRARSSREQNLNVFQENKDIFFITTKDVQPGTELLYWYAADYANILGLSILRVHPGYIRRSFLKHVVAFVTQACALHPKASSAVHRATVTSLTR